MVRHVGVMGRQARSRSDTDDEVSDHDETPADEPPADEPPADEPPADEKVARLPGPEERRFGQHVRRLRRARGVTQDRLAERAGLSPDTIRRLEHGLFSPSLETLTKLCFGLQLARSTLFESYELGESDQTREIVDLLLTRSSNEIKLAVRVLRNLLDSMDDLALAGTHADESGE